MPFPFDNYPPTYPPQGYYTSQANPFMFGPSAPPGYNSGLSNLLGPQLAAQIEPALQMGQIFLPQVMPQLQQSGFMMPQFFNTQNYVSRVRAQQFATNSAIATQAATQQATNNLYQVIAGAMAVTQSTPLTAAQQQNALGMAQTVAPIYNAMSASMPSYLADIIYGPGGNPLRLNQGMLLTGQNMRDPVTGMRGFSGQTAAAVGERVYNRLYGGGTDPVAISQMMGTTTAQVAELLDNLGQRGLLASRRTLADLAGDLPSVTLNDQSIKEIGDRARGRDAGITDSAVEATYNQMRTLARSGTPQALQQLQQLASTTSGQEILRSSDADRITRTIQGYNDALVAMRDIFGDAGNPNAPVAELMNSLDQFTQGGLATTNPGNRAQLRGLAESVRTTYELGRMNNFNLPTMQALMAEASAQARAAGLDPQLSVNTMQNSMAFTASEAEMARFAENRSFGSFDREKLLLTEMRLQTGAAASPVARRLGAIVAMYKQGVPLSGALLETAQVLTGEKPGGKIPLTQEQLSSAAINSELQRIGVTSAVARNYLMNDQLSQDMISTYDIGGRVRDELQPQEVKRAVANRLKRSLRDVAGGETLAKKTSAALFELGADAQDFEKRKAAFEKILDAEAGAGTKAEADLFRKYGVNSRDALLTRFSHQMFNDVQADRNIQQRFGNPQQFFEYFNPQAVENRQRTEREARTTGAMAAALAPLGRGDAITNFVQQLKNAAQPGAAPVTLASLLQNSLGMVTAESLAEIAPEAGAALKSALLLAQEGAALAADPNFDNDPEKRRLHDEKVAAVRALVSGEGAAEALTAQQARLQAMRDAAPGTYTTEAIAQQESLVQGLTFVQSRGMGIGAIVTNQQMLGQASATDHLNRIQAFSFAEKNNLLGGKKWEDIQRMTDAQFAEFMTGLETSSSGDPAKKEAFEKMKAGQARVAANAAPEGVAAAGAAPVQVQFPDRMAVYGTLNIDMDSRIARITADSEAALDPSMTPPAAAT